MLLKWVGSKRRQLSFILERIPKDIENYVEPFLGGGSVFFAIRKRIKGAVILGDTNAPLMNFYRMVRDTPSELIDQLQRYENNQEEYYSVRERYNDHKHLAGYAENPSTDDLILLAADFYYLNRCGYRGLYREARRDGRFNVPYGHYKSPWRPPDASLVREASVALRYSSLLTWPFAYTISTAPKNSFIYCDPPYTGGFVYGRAIDDRELVSFLGRAREKGSCYAVSGPDEEWLRNLYPNAVAHKIDTRHKIRHGAGHSELLLIGG